MKGEGCRLIMPFSAKVTTCIPTAQVWVPWCLGLSLHFPCRRQAHGFLAQEVSGDWDTLLTVAL
jgi:hypothetical protein